VRLLLWLGANVKGLSRADLQGYRGFAGDRKMVRCLRRWSEKRLLGANASGGKTEGVPKAIVEQIAFRVFEVERDN
jgi:hypothetical protein